MFHFVQFCFQLTSNELMCLNLTFISIHNSLNMKVIIEGFYKTEFRENLSEQIGKRIGTSSLKTSLLDKVNILTISLVSSVE